MATNWNAEGVDFGNFFPVQANYGPRDIFAEAALVTKNNVGQWALEFEMDVKNVGGSHHFDIFATREGDTPIRLTIKPGVWVVKVWGELHIFDDGLFQSTFDVPKDQMKAVRKAHREKDIELEREWQQEQKEVCSALEADFEAKLDKALETGNWDDLDIPERQILRHRLKEDEKFKVYLVAAQLMMDAKKKALKEYAAKDAEVTQHLHIPIADLVDEIKKSGVAPDYHAGSLYKSEGQDPEIYEATMMDAKRLAGETLEVRTENASGEKVLMREGVYDQLSDGAKSIFSPVEETRIVPAVGELDTDESNGRLE